MERMTVCMSSNDIDLFERKRSELGMSKSAFIRFLIAEHEKEIPSSIKYKEIIDKLAEANTILNEILISEKFDTSVKILLDEKFKEVSALFKEKL